MYENLDFQNVKTYLQSGNVIFQTNETPVKVLETAISDKITEMFGFDVPVIVLDINDLQEIINNNPFAQRASEFLYITILAAEPQNDFFEKINTKKAENEEFAVIKRAAYFYLPNGYGNTKLNNNLMENALKTKATTRNWKTLNALAELAK